MQSRNFDASHFFAVAVFGALFGAGLVWHELGARLGAQEREVRFLRAEYFRALGLAHAATDLAGQARDVAAQYAAEVLALRRQRLESTLTLYVRRVNPQAPAERVVRAIVVSAERNGLDIVWWMAQIEQESHFDSHAVSRAGAQGLAQIMPDTARRLGMDWAKRFHIETSLEFGARYMAQHLRTYGSIERAQARYSGGEAQYSVLIHRRYVKIKATLAKSLL